MAVKHSRVPVGTTATELVTVADGSLGKGPISRTLVIQNPSDVEVHLGGPGVTTATSGYVLAGKSEVALDLTSADKMYAVAASAVTLYLLHLAV